MSGSMRQCLGVLHPGVLKGRTVDEARPYSAYTDSAPSPVLSQTHVGPSQGAGGSIPNRMISAL